MFPKLWSYRAVINGKSGYLTETGWKESVKRGYPCRKDGSELPWMNYSIISFLEERLNKSHDLFEFGSGFSTIFFARRVSTVTSLEYDEKWFETISAKAPENATIKFIPNDIDGKYCRAISDTGRKFDIVIVDGRDRVNCFKQSLICLSESGIILLDDSTRERYIEAFEIANKEGFRTLNFVGLKPTGIGSDRTTIFYRDGNCLSI